MTKNQKPLSSRTPNISDGKAMSDLFLIFALLIQRAGE
jgi:hypothetical protein